MEAQETIIKEALQDIILNVFSLMLDLKVNVLSADEALDQDRPTRACAVHILGGWNGSLSVQGTHQFIREVASRTFGNVDAPEPLQRDSLYELTNVLGGNLKSILGVGCVLSTPKVIDGIGYSFTVPGSVDVCRVVMECLGERALVGVHRGLLQLRHIPTLQIPQR
jgi:CheY-specific phosphatase CheX